MRPTILGCCTARIVGGGQTPPHRHVYLSCLPASCQRLPYGYFRPIWRWPPEGRPDLYEDLEPDAYSAMRYT